MLTIHFWPLNIYRFKGSEAVDAVTVWTHSSQSLCDATCMPLNSEGFDGVI